MLNTSDNRKHKIIAEPKSLVWIEVAEEFEYLLSDDIIEFFFNEAGLERSWNIM